MPAICSSLAVCLAWSGWVSCWWCRSRGHAESTAGAGQPGNAVLLGHVTSVHSGNVFQDLDRARIGDVVNVLADDRAFEYRVVSIARVPRSDASVLQPGESSAVSLITCT